MKGERTCTKVPDGGWFECVFVSSKVLNVEITSIDKLLLFAGWWYLVFQSFRWIINRDFLLKGEILQLVFQRYFVTYFPNSHFSQIRKIEEFEFHRWTRMFFLLLLDLFGLLVLRILNVFRLKSFDWIKFDCLDLTPCYQTIVSFWLQREIALNHLTLITKDWLEFVCSVPVIYMRSFWGKIKVFLKLFLTKR